MKITMIALTLATSLSMTAAHAEAVQAGSTASANASAGIEIAQNRSYLDVLASLENEGYSINQVETTWLGRIKITAQSQANLREVVVSRTTGEIMSDVILQVFATGDSGTAGAPEEATAGQSGTGGVLGLSTTLSVGANGAAGGNGGGGNVGLSGGGGVSLGN